MSKKFDIAVNKFVKNLIPQIESKHDVSVLFASESGSRAWGFESPDSDYDVRFIYVEKPAYYLSIAQSPPDVLQPKTDGDLSGKLDVVGWELRKALRLLYNGNPNLVDWINSPTVYHEIGVFSYVRELAQEQLWPVTFYYHHWSLAGKHWKRYIEGQDRVDLKRYLYTVRSMSCANIARDGKMPPVNFWSALALDWRMPNAIRRIVGDLAKQKMAAGESGQVEPIPDLDAYIQDWTAFSHHVPKNPPIDVEPFNRALRTLVNSYSTTVATWR